MESYLTNRLKPFIRQMVKADHDGLPLSLIDLDGINSKKIGCANPHQTLFCTQNLAYICDELSNLSELIMLYKTCTICHIILLFFGQSSTYRASC